MAYLLDLLDAFLSSPNGQASREPEQRPSAVRIYYRTRDGLADYRFSIERQTNGAYRVFILAQPSYGSKSTAAHATHRLSAGGRHYVCWNRPLRSEGEAKTVAALWADATQQYIKSGRRF